MCLRFRVLTAHGGLSGKVGGKPLEVQRGLPDTQNQPPRHRRRKSHAPERLGREARLRHPGSRFGIDTLDLPDQRGQVALAVKDARDGVVRDVDVLREFSGVDEAKGIQLVAPETAGVDGFCGVRRCAHDFDRPNWEGGVRGIWWRCYKTLKCYN